MHLGVPETNKTSTRALRLHSLPYISVYLFCVYSISKQQVHTDMREYVRWPLSFVPLLDDLYLHASMRLTVPAYTTFPLLFINILFHPLCSSLSLSMTINSANVPAQFSHQQLKTFVVLGPFPLSCFYRYVAATAPLKPKKICMLGTWHRYKRKNETRHAK